MAKRPNVSAAHLLQAEINLGHCAVCLVGPADAIPRHFGDNMGGRPCRIVTTIKPKDAAKTDDLSQPYHRFLVLDFVWVGSGELARRLKAKLDELLLGKLRHGWRDIEDPEIAWPLLLGEAARELGVTMFGEEQRQRLIQAELSRMARAGRRR